MPGEYCTSEYRPLLRMSVPYGSLAADAEQHADELTLIAHNADSPQYDGRNDVETIT